MKAEQLAQGEERTKVQEAGPDLWDMDQHAGRGGGRTRPPTLPEDISCIARIFNKNSKDTKTTMASWLLSLLLI